MAWFVSPQSGPTRLGRSLRLATGLILFAYATSHFLNHAFGIRSVEAMQAASGFLLKPWQTIPGLVALYSALLLHAALGLAALYRRRHMRMPAGETWQMVLGLAIPVLLIPHAAAIRIGQSGFGFEYGYDWVMYQFWVAAPQLALPRQYPLLLMVWVHGCIGIRAWLRANPWYPRAAAPLASLATLVPVLALLGFTNAGVALREAIQSDPALAARFAAAKAAAAAANAATLTDIVDTTLAAYVGLVAAAFVVRAARDWRARRLCAVRIAYPDGRAVTVPSGFSVLEASRWAGIPHTSVCGGRGRCSTCRVRIVDGAQALPPPGPIERATLARLGTPANVRLACQLRPHGDIKIELLVRPPALRRPGSRFAAAVAGGKELEVAALFIDVRESTRLASSRLPYDALCLFDHYIALVTSAVRDNGGQVTSVAGDGVMSVFGAEGDTAGAAPNAFRAAIQIWAGLDAMNGELMDELESPMRIGMGLHVGVAVVAAPARGGFPTLQFLGDTGNIAAKLEEATRRLDCTLLASNDSLARVGLPAAELEKAMVPIAGRAVSAAVFREMSALSSLVGSAE